MDTIFSFITHYDIRMGNDRARDVHCDIIMDHDIVIGTYCYVTMHVDVVKPIIYYVLPHPIIMFCFLVEIFKIIH